MIRLHVDRKYKQGTRVKIEGENKVYEIISCVDLDWLTRGEKSGYLAVLKEVQE